eukprot:CAMPEP_0177786038 /NCGR_PEP_ID=MMETSP0491_2-20121128/20698_1 /TAXON_ID=63592 /ORGANISM="Tetraselmis chuii, Strain PLY429" /LENGTH=49 /DNA_ID= /DNA_START= /DNA_END= /DNA_ORIENTATION=
MEAHDVATCTLLPYKISGGTRSSFTLSTAITTSVTPENSGAGLSAQVSA